VVLYGFSGFDRDLSNYNSYLKIMTQKLQQRGPDEFGYYTSKNISLGQRRLVIVDGAGGKQPMTVQHFDNTYTLVYNGQLYNTEDIRQELLSAGFDFFGYSDTEVLLKAFIHFGHDVVKKLNGIYSFGIWDENKQELFLARDHFGIKPLFYTIVDNILVFGSEIKSILEFPLVKPKIDLQGISELFGLRSCSYSRKSVFLKIYLK
jgi:asparagine synthase (glutamine-hydrolysing)